MPAFKKHSSVRARANQAATAAVLEDDADSLDVEVDIPVLPTRYDAAGEPMDWRQETLDWWEDLWLSPMRHEFLDADVHGLFRLAALVDNYWRNPCAATHAEVRLAQKDYGLTPYDRRRLEWSIKRPPKQSTPTAGAAPTADHHSAVPPAAANDPRLTLVQ